MSIITKMNSIPLFTKKAEALKWGKLNGLSGYHKHTYFGKIGYMAGRTHSEISRATTFITEKTIDMSTIKVQQDIYTTKGSSSGGTGFTSQQDGYGTSQNGAFDDTGDDIGGSGEDAGGGETDPGSFDDGGY